MSTSYGIAIVQFPGFKAAKFNTIEDVMVTRSRCGYGSSRLLPPRSLTFEDGTKRRLSRKERSRLRTLSQVWSQRRRYDEKSYRYIYPFRNIRVENVC